MAKTLLPYMRMGIMTRAVQTFDKNSGIIVGIVWMAALILLVLANMGVGRALSARELLAAAEASTPLTPQITQSKLGDNEIKIITEKLQKRYSSTLQIGQKQGDNIITITAKDPASFSTWLTAITYLDIIRPEVEWKIDNFCVGPKCGDFIMGASLSAQAVAFTVPVPSE